MSQTNEMQEHRNRGPHLLFIGVLFSIFYWILESVRDVVGFEKGTLLNRIFLPDTITLWIRLLVVFIIILFSAYIQNLKKKTKDFKVRSPRAVENLGLIWVALIFGIFYWILEAIRDVFVFDKQNLIRQIFTPDPLGFWMRFLGVGILLLMGIYMQNLIKTSKRKEAELKEQHNQIIKDIKAQNGILIKENERLKMELELGKQKAESEEGMMWEWGDLYFNNTHLMVKSNLQSISRLLDLKKENMNDQNIIGILNETSAKIYTLSLVHSQIVKEKQFDKINLRAYVKDMTEYLSHVFITKPIELVISKDDIPLPIKYAYPCAFVLNEVILNVYKHAFKAGEKGTLGITLNKVKNGIFSFKVHDNGIGIPTEYQIENSQMAGLKWIHDIVVNQLKGKITVEPEDGTQVMVEFNVS